MIDFPKKYKRLKIKVPDTFSVQTKRFMKTVLHELNEREELNPMMEGVLMMLANCYESFINASEQVRLDGCTTTNIKDEIITHPAVGIQLKSNQQVLALMKELGLTIKSRRVLENSKEDSSLLSLFEAENYEN